MKNVLLAMDNRLELGGIQVFLKNVVECMDRSQYRFTYYIPFCDAKDESLYQWFANHDVKLVFGGYTYSFKVPLIKKVLQFIGMWRDMDRLEQETYFDIVHANSGGSLFHVVAMMASRKNKVGIRIVHGHGDGIKSKNAFKQLAYRISQAIIRRDSTVIAACSDRAATWIAGQNVQYTWIKNKIDAERFQYDPKARERIRRRFSLDGRFILGNIGRFEEQKNHHFLIEIFEYVYQQDRQAALLLVGTGALEKEIKDLVQAKGLSDAVCFAGTSENPEEYYSAMDVFVMPSLWEGFGIVILEAQCNGLPCIISNVIPSEIHITNLVEALPLDHPEDWAAAIEKRKNLPLDRRCGMQEWIKVAGYDIGNLRQDIECIYSSVEVL